MAYATGPSESAWFTARSGSAQIATDSATLTDANILPAEGFTCRGLETIWVRVEITNGTNPTMTLEALYRDEDAADGARWVRNRDSSGVLTTPALAVGQAAEITVDGWHKVHLRISAVANATSTTAWKIQVRPGKRRRSTPSR